MSAEAPKQAKKEETVESAAAEAAGEAEEATSEMASLNDLLMQASSSVIDIEDEVDPALASTSSAIMDSYTPESIHGKLIEQLGEMGEDSRASELISQMQPTGLGQYGLTLACDKSHLNTDDQAFLEFPKTQQLLANAFRALRLPGKVKINYVNGAPEEGTRVKYRPASILELQRIAGETPFIELANRILSTKLTEARIPER